MYEMLALIHQFYFNKEQSQPNKLTWPYNPNVQRSYTYPEPTKLEEANPKTLDPASNLVSDDKEKQINDDVELGNGAKVRINNNITQQSLINRIIKNPEFYSGLSRMRR